ncbi:hypothetical protein U9M48_012364 [Paspalum notatum var. saurae]|uniref:Thioredoxin domain-containing protein n=1 Tax=Paspalum notatum var. saurae TaxID=547442 RepID=A0AAQ3SY48_PASNO
MSLAVAGARASLAASSPRPRLLAAPLRRRPFGSLASPPAAGRRRLRVRMARTESTGVSVGFRAPHFEDVQLPEPLTGTLWTLDDFEGNPALLVMFICNHCPFVKHLKKDIAKLTSFYMEKGLGAVAISSNSIRTHPQVRGYNRWMPLFVFSAISDADRGHDLIINAKDMPHVLAIQLCFWDGPERMAEEAKLFKYPFPYLYDESQEVAKAFGAVCTPEFYLFKKDGRRPFELFYHGQFDDSRPSNNVPVTGRDLSRAIDCALSGQELSFVQKPSVGCSIKWHP